MTQFRGFTFSIPNLPKDWYEYLKHVREGTGLSPWQVVILALMALKELAQAGDTRVLEWVEVVKREHPKP